MLSRNDIFSVLGALSKIELYNNTDVNIEKSFQLLEANMDISTLNSLQCLKLIYKNSTFSSLSSLSKYKFVFIGLECLMRLKETLQQQSYEEERLLSVSQQRSVRALLDKVIQLGLLPNLLPGVEHSPYTGSYMSTDAPSTPSDMEKYECLCVVTLVLIDLYHNETFHGILLPQFLAPMMVALCQLTMVPLKKSTDTFPRLQKERLIFQQHLDELITKLYQPMIIKELMIIEGNRKSPKWLKRGVGKLLTQQLHRPNGVLAVVQAVRDAANCTAPTTLQHLESVAQVITASPDLHIICPQILELLDSSDAELIRVAVICVKTLLSRDSTACNLHLLQPMTKPLSSPLSTEQSLSLCLLRLHKCFAVPASDLWCLPSQLLHRHIQILFQLYQKTYQSASHIRKTVEDLVWCFLSKCEDNILSDVFRCLLFRDCVHGIDIVNGVECVFSDDGGVKLILSGQNDYSLEELGDCFMILLERLDANGKIGNKLFVTLLECAALKKELDTVDIFERQLLTIKLLAVLSENSAVQKHLSEHPEPVVRFLSAMIDNFVVNGTCEVEMISVVLVVLNVILHDCIYSKKCSWPVFNQLEKPLLLLKNKTENTELRILAEEAYNIILTHGAVKPNGNEGRPGEERTSSFRTKVSVCDKALQEACDPLLPVRGHAIILLGKLLAAGNQQAKAKKEQILCIFQENLKNEDSFLYLSAIEGLAVAATEFPDTVILSLIEQFSHRSLTANARLKVGEALVRVTKLLGELAPVYKAELINTFLTGTRDDDFLVRTSSLSNLGELCRILAFRVGPIVAEVLMCARCIVSSDPSVEVRRAAVMLVHLLLKGLHKDALTVLQDVLLELYHSLKRIYSSDKDDVTRLHAQLALEELNCGTLAFLFPKPQLTKQIFVLNPPTE